MSANITLKQARSEIKSLDKKATQNLARAINKAAAQARTQGGRNIRDEVRLKASYINQHLKVAKKASPNSLIAIIRATRRPVLLSRFGAKPLTKAAAGAKGNAVLGIPAGRKQVGVSVHVGRSEARKKMLGAFLLPLSNSNGLGVAVRTGSGRSAIDVKYGPSVDQVFRNTRGDLVEQAQESVAAEFHRLTRAGI